VSFICYFSLHSPITAARCVFFSFSLSHIINTKIGYCSLSPIFIRIFVVCFCYSLVLSPNHQAGEPDLRTELKEPMELTQPNLPMEPNLPAEPNFADGAVGAKISDRAKFAD
jgi:hypothetical protein